MIALTNIYNLIADLIMILDEYENVGASFQRLRAVQEYKVWHVLVVVCLLPSWAVMGAIYAVIVAIQFVLNVPVFKRK
ncbi:hypothetical protein MKZ21_30965 [Paenibacillus sp. FSL P2-0536]|uniref:hypothetical protein n=1 Tax=Paenibacillus sp. FSL P2-0536 TaxID=2921629 RepID=UPI0030FD1CBC